MNDARPTNAVVDVFALFIFVGAIVGIAWLLFWKLPEWKEARMIDLYRSCVERGGLITEGGLSGPECVGVKVRP